MKRKLIELGEWVLAGLMLVFFAVFIYAVTIGRVPLR
jgi:hypothetical protein